MHTFRTLTVGVVATLCLAATPDTRAQSPEDLETIQTFLAIMTDYFKIIESTYDISSSNEKSAIMKMQKIQEIYEERGEKGRAADVLRQVLSETDNTTIRNAAFFLLGDNLKDTGRSEEAITMLREGLSENIKAAQ